jgi:hypothetical protein
MAILRGHVSARVRCRREVSPKADRSVINSRRVLGWARRSCPVSGPPPARLLFGDDEWRVACGLRRSSGRSRQAGLNEFP